MAWTSPLTWVINQVVTAANLNQQLRDNMNCTMPAIVTTKGDMAAATGANAISRVPVGADGTHLIADSSQAAGVKFGQPLVSNGVAKFAFDLSAGPALVVGNGGLGYPFSSANNFAGLLLITETAWPGGTALFLVGGSATGLVLVSQSIAGKYSATYNNLSTINVYAASSIVTIQNKSGVSNNYICVAIRTKTTI